MKLFSTLSVAIAFAGGLASADTLSCHTYVQSYKDSPTAHHGPKRLVRLAADKLEESQGATSIIGFEEVNVISPNGPRVDTTADNRVCAVTPDVQVEFKWANDATYYSVSVDVVTLSGTPNGAFENSPIDARLDKSGNQVSLAHDIRTGVGTRSGWVPKGVDADHSFRESSNRYVVWLDATASPSGKTAAFLCGRACEVSLNLDWVGSFVDYHPPLEDAAPATTPQPSAPEDVAEANTGIDAALEETAAISVSEKEGTTDGTETETTAPSTEQEDEQTVVETTSENEAEAAGEAEEEVAQLKAEWLDADLNDHVSVRFVDPDGNPVAASEVQLERFNCSTNGLSLRSILADMYRRSCLNTPFDSDWQISGSEVKDSADAAMIEVVIRVEARQNPFFNGLTVTLPPDVRYDPDCGFSVTLLGRNGQDPLANGIPLFGEPGRYFIDVTNLPGYSETSRWRWRDMSIAFTPGPQGSNCKPASKSTIALRNHTMMDDVSVDLEGRVRIENFALVSARPMVHILVNNQIGSRSTPPDTLDPAYPWRFEDELREYLDVFLKLGVEAFAEDDRAFSKIGFYFVDDRGQFTEAPTLDLNVTSDLIRQTTQFVNEIPLQSSEYTDDRPAIYLRRLIDSDALDPTSDLVILYGRAGPRSASTTCDVSVDLLELGLDLSVFEFAKNRDNPNLDGAIDADVDEAAFQAIPGRVPTYNCVASPAGVHWLVQPDGPRSFPGARAVHDATAPFFHALASEASK